MRRPVTNLSAPRPRGHRSAGSGKKNGWRPAGRQTAGVGGQERAGQAGQAQAARRVVQALRSQPGGGWVTLQQHGSEDLQGSTCPFRTKKARPRGADRSGTARSRNGSTITTKRRE
eukprot:12334899-Heterocapsa_arctica.AAC.1